MDILVIGAGEVGLHLAKSLTKEGHRVTLVDHDRAALDRVGVSADVQTFHGHGSDSGLLERAGAADADLVVAATNDDELNLVAGVIARKLGAKRTAIRVHAARHVRANQYFYKDCFDFDLAIAPEEIAAFEILKTVRGASVLPVETFANGRLQMRRFEITEDAPVAGQPCGAIKLPPKVVGAAHLRGVEVTIPRDDLVLNVGDFLVLAGVPEALETAEKILGGKRALPKRVLVAGSSDIALLVARGLADEGIPVRLIVEDEEEARALSAALGGTDIVRGSPTDLELLGQEGVHRADWFVALGNQDEMNLLACQLAKSAGAKRTIAVVHHSDYAALVDRLGIDHAVTPRRLVARRLAQFVRADAEGGIAQLHHGAAEVIDRHLRAGSPLAGKSLAEIGIPCGAVVCGIIRNDEVLVPRQETRLAEGDHVIVFALRAVVRELEAYFAHAPAGEGASP